MAKHVRVTFSSGKIVTSGNAYDRPEDLDSKSKDIISRHRENRESYEIEYIKEEDLVNEEAVYR